MAEEERKRAASQLEKARMKKERQTSQLDMSREFLEEGVRTEEDCAWRACERSILTLPPQKASDRRPYDDERKRAREAVDEAKLLDAKRRASSSQAYYGEEQPQEEDEEDDSMVVADEVPFFSVRNAIGHAARICSINPGSGDGPANPVFAFVSHKFSVGLDLTARRPSIP